MRRTSIPNDNSNLNTGALPEGRGVFLLSNVAQVKAPPPAPLHTLWSDHPDHPDRSPQQARDPLTLSLSRDGFNFSVCRCERGLQFSI